MKKKEKITETAKNKSEINQREIGNATVTADQIQACAATFSIFQQSAT
jgi:hypothetical protein